MDKIFCQIASYRDPQLIPTIESMIENAECPENLILGICRQFNPEDEFDNLDKYRSDKRFRIIDVPYKEATGVCKARNSVQKLYKNEKYTLQIDSHMRFEKNWDTTLIGMIEQLQEMGIPKPLLTGYVSSFNPNNDPNGRIKVPWRMAFDRYTPEGVVFFLPESISNWEDIESPIPARFYSAHFAFTLGQFCKEVKHNPNYYFHGEEISISARAFSWGYDMFHPHRVVVWHEYTREGRQKQWDDDKNWGNKNNESHLINRQLFGMDGLEQKGHDGEYGFGPVRTLREYEKFSGLHFASRSVQQYTLDKHYPPNPEIEDEEEWLKSFTKVFKHCIDVSKQSLPDKDYDFLAVAFHGKDDKTLFRKDFDKNEIKGQMSNNDPFLKIWRDFLTDENPAYWVVWPHSESKGWCERITGNLI